ncbi:MAG: hypothetical protein ACYC96_06365 [Fimbriimonadaceae bacterium]
MRVSVSGKQFVFPRSCACCGAFPTTTLAVSGAEKNRRARTRGWVWDIPYCWKCRQHIRALDYLRGGLLIAASLACLAGVAVALADRSWIFGLAVWALALAALGSAGFLTYLLIRRRATVNCCQMGRSVIYLGSDGPCHSFDSKSTFYAADFVRANHRKLVNASVRVASILRNTEFSKHRMPRRLLRER